MRCLQVTAPSVIVAALVLGGCGDGSSAAPSSESSQPTTAGPEEPAVQPTDRAGEPLVEPERPAAMADADVAGAQAAAEYFMELSGYAVTSQDVTAFRRLCDPQSSYCTAVIDQVAADVAAGYYALGGEATLSVVSVTAPGADPYFTVRGELDRRPLQVFTKEGELLLETEAEVSLDLTVVLQHADDGQWLVVGAETQVEKK